MRKMIQLVMLMGSCSMASAAFGAEHVIVQKGKVFSQDEITIAPGDTVVFKNEDDTSHNVFSSSESMKFNLGVQKAGVATPHKFETAGSGEVRCAIHPKMKIKVTVK